MDAWMNGRMDRRTVTWIDRWMARQTAKEHLVVTLFPDHTLQINPLK